jgi:hypothetical protein
MGKGSKFGEGETKVRFNQDICDFCLQTLRQHLHEGERTELCKFGKRRESLVRGKRI